jgi:ribosomal protein L23
VQDLFQVEALKVNTRITKEGKLAIITLTADHSAEDLSNRLGIL